MAYDIIPILILIGCLVGLTVIVAKKIPQLKRLDVSSIPAERELRLKQHLLATRLRRHIEVIGRALATLGRPVLLAAVKVLKRAQQRVMDLEVKYRKPKPATTAGILTSEFDELLAAAGQLRANGDRAAAEEKLMKAIGLDPRSLPAYELLGELYLESHDNAKAREVYGYLVKLLRRIKTDDGSKAHRLASCYLNLATAHLGLSHNAQALQYARKAVAIESNNPRMLDFLMKISILLKDKALASKTWGALQQADPNNAKLAELKQQIDELP